MKTSLLVMGTVVLMGSATLAQAGTTESQAWTPTSPQPVIVNSATNSGSVAASLADLSAAGAVHEADSPHASRSPATGHSAGADGSPRQHPRRQLAPPLPTGTDLDGMSAAQPATSSSSTARPELGWQSLLPGSIQ